MLRSLRFRLPALFLAGVVVSGLVAAVVAFQLFQSYSLKRAKEELRREGTGITQLYVDQVTGSNDPVAASQVERATGDRIVALIEIVSPGNKQTEVMPQAFIDKAAAALQEGYHLLIVDLWPPGSFDPSGIHGALWSLVGGTVYRAQTDRPLTLAAYAVRAPGLFTAYVEPLSVGAELPDMPLFLAPEHYINVPLERTYAAAWEGVPERWRRVIESKG